MNNPKINSAMRPEGAKPPSIGGCLIMLAVLVVLVGGCSAIVFGGDDELKIENSPASEMSTSDFKASASTTIADARQEIEMVEGLATVYSTDRANAYASLNGVAERVDAIKSSWRSIKSPGGKADDIHEQIATGLYVQAKAMDNVLEAVDSDSVAKATEAVDRLQDASAYFDRAESALGDL